MKRFCRLSKLWKSLGALTVAVASILMCGQGNAHFNLDLNIRTIHVVHTKEGLDVYIRVPTPYFLAGFISEPLADGTVIPAPFTYNRIENDNLNHYLSMNQIANSPLEFAALAAEGLHIETEGKALKPEIIQMRLHTVLEQPPFASLDEARSSLSASSLENTSDDIYVGETVTDLLLRYQHDSPVNSYKLSFTWNPKLEMQEETANLLLDHFPGDTRIFRFTGTLNDPVEITNSAFAAFATFTTQGIIHIIEGWDHLLFVICLAIGAATLTGLLWRVTGFTIGHTITLIMGFWGYVPSGSWFIPSVELGIAISIIFVALAAISTSKRQSDSFSSFIVTLLIGLLHGLGFSFVLHELLLPNGAHLWKSLLAFNVGVEIGQVAIVTGVWIILLSLKKIRRSLLVPARWAVALPSLAIATYWAVQRFQSVMATISS